MPLHFTANIHTLANAICNISDRNVMIKSILLQQSIDIYYKIVEKKRKNANEC